MKNKTCEIIKKNLRSKGYKIILNTKGTPIANLKDSRKKIKDYQSLIDLYKKQKSTH